MYCLDSTGIVSLFISESNIINRFDGSRNYPLHKNTQILLLYNTSTIDITTTIIFMSNLTLESSKYL